MLQPGWRPPPLSVAENCYEDLAASAVPGTGWVRQLAPLIVLARLAAAVSVSLLGLDLGQVPSHAIGASSTLISPHATQHPLSAIGFGCSSHVLWLQANTLLPDLQP